MKTLTAYTDGSYDDKTKKYGYGCIVIDEENNIMKKTKGSGNDIHSSRNVSGELLAVQTAIKFALTNNYDKIIIYYDYTGIENWANGSWKTNKPVSIDYKQFINKARTKLQIEFVKVKAHSGDKYNEMVDGLAKEALRG